MDVTSANEVPVDTATATAPHDDYVDPRVVRTERAVVAAAAQLLLDDGPDALTHTRIAEETSYSRTTIYKYWPTRADLLRAALERLGHRPSLGVPGVGDLRGDLSLLLGHLVADLRDEEHCRLMLTMMERSRHDPIVAEVRDQMMAEVNTTMAAVLDAAVARGELRADVDPGLAAASLAGSLMYIAFLAGDDVDDDTVARLIDDFATNHAPR